MSYRVPYPPQSKIGNGLSEEDFYLNEDGLMVFTAAYHRKRGYCCQSGCRHCPYGFRKSVEAKR